MNRNRKNLRSTTNSPASKAPIEQDFRPTTFIGATIADTHDSTIYTDQTGNSPVRSFHGKRCKFIAYEYRSNAILCRALKDQTDASMIEAFQDVYQYLESKGFKPKLNVIDNQCSKAIQRFIKSTGADIQLVTPDDHRVNAAERANQTSWKNHWILPRPKQTKYMGKPHS